jgi:hypothetical protein
MAPNPESFIDKCYKLGRNRASGEYLGVKPGPNLAGSRDNGRIRASERLTHLILPHILSLD